MLRGVIGTEKFWAGIREYYRRFRDSNASTEDLRHVMEETSGADLGWFFQQWLYRAGSPVVSGGWKYNAAAKMVEIELAQTQSGAAYRLPLEIAVSVAGAPPAIRRVECSGKSQKFEIPADQRALVGGTGSQRLGADGQQIQERLKSADLTIRMESLAKHRSEATVYLGRQPIYGANREIRAYELLYRRAAGDTSARFRDGDRASAEVMLNAFLEIGLPTVSPLRPVFINHTRHLLTMDPIRSGRPLRHRGTGGCGRRSGDPGRAQPAEEPELPHCAGRFRLFRETRPDDRTRRLREAGPARAGFRTLSRTVHPAAPLRSRHCRREDRIRGRVPMVPETGLRPLPGLLPAPSGSALGPPHSRPIASRCSRFSASAPTWKAPPT